MAARRSPPRRRRRPAYSFTVEIEGIQTGRFAEVGGLGVETEVTEFREGGSHGIRKVPGLSKFTNVVLKRGFTANTALYDWAMANLRGGSVTRATVLVVMSDAAGREIARWTLQRAWPVKWEGPTLSASGNEVAIESIELAHEGLSMTTQ